MAADNSDESFTVRVHPYPSPTRASCAYEIGDQRALNAIIFIGGLHDGPHTVPYIRTVAQALYDKSDSGYSVFEIRMRSSFIGFGTSSLQRDVKDISALVTYLRGKGRRKIILFGHSTGCQDCMEYANDKREDVEPVDGYIMQAPVSDRDGLDYPKTEEALAFADKWIAEGKENWCMPRDLVPKEFGAPITAYRLRSLLAKGGDDDYFSADLEDEKVHQHWSGFKKPVLVLHSGSDEFVPKHINQAALLKRYQAANALVSPLSAPIPNAGHTVEDPEARQFVADKVIAFVETPELL